MTSVSYLAPIVVMSFDRADYLEQVLESLMRQRGCSIEGRRILLFQDGANNPFSDLAHAAQKSIGASMAAFSRLVPGGTVMLALDNLGVALNFDRSERFAFEELDAKAAIFLEDDLVLSDQYIATLDQLINAHMDDARVGYVAAYGDHMLSLAEQQADPARLAVLHHLWGFGSFQRQWRLIRPQVEQYLGHVRNIDYRTRDHGAIKALYASWGFDCPVSSQDAAKTLACVFTNTIKVNTRIVLGRYIGERGLHMDAELFAERGYSRTAMFTDPVPVLEMITDTVYKNIMEEMRDWAGRPEAT